MQGLGVAQQGVIFVIWAPPPRHCPSVLSCGHADEFLPHNLTEFRNQRCRAATRAKEVERKAAITTNRTRTYSCQLHKDPATMRSGSLFHR